MSCSSAGAITSRHDLFRLRAGIRRAGIAIET
jgi:hypothetical protein